MTPDRDSIAVRKIESFEEMDACVHLQQQVWQFPDLDLIPRRMFVVARAVGGQIFGAWDGERLAGYALAIPGVRQGKPYLHSHMLAVAPEYRDLGLGMRLKLAQRDDALARGIELIEWTFDPQQARNAYFNIEKLGAVIRCYTPDFYGSSRSPLHGSIPTDRLHAEWWLSSKRVEALLQGGNLPEYVIKETVPVTNENQPRETVRGPSAATDLASLLRVRGQFLDAFSKGLMGLRFVRAPETAYLLGPADQFG